MVAVAKAEAPHVCTSSFEGGTGDFQWLEGESGRWVLQPPWPLGRNPSVRYIAVWPSGSCFESMQINLFWGKTDNLVIVPAPYALSPGRIHGTL